MLIYILLASASAFTLSSINVALMGSNDHSCNVASDLPAIAVSMVLDLPCGACVDVSTPKKQRKSIPTTKSTSPPKPKSISPPKPTSPQKPPPSFAGFKCAICLDVPEVQNMSSTKCGHIYCTACIDACYQRDKSCPICRKKITKGSIFRLYV